MIRSLNRVAQHSFTLTKKGGLAPSFGTLSKRNFSTPVTPAASKDDTVTDDIFQSADFYTE